MAVHPHMRGEYGGPALAFRRPCGSSPHAWGIPIRGHKSGLRPRFIPTCVGNTAAVPVACGLWPVHPHMRGEYIRWGGKRHGVNGSSPHAWGIRRRSKMVKRGGRFIPTCVGNTFAISVRILASCGSSPHAWGIQGFYQDSVLPRRFIPTCVGNTDDVIRLGCEGAVHPHMRGEYDQFVHCYLTAVRFIPTCVGNTSGLLGWIAFQPVHPHMRGEYITVDFSMFADAGSSPHAWGIRLSSFSLVHE